MTPEQIRTRIAELDREINEQVAAVRLPSSAFTRRFPSFTWLLCGFCFAWYLYGNQIPGASDIHHRYGLVGYYGGIAMGIVALWGTLLYLMQPRVKVSPEYRANAERVRGLQEERRELVALLRSLNQD